jgi:hypothetical protein
MAKTVGQLPPKWAPYWASNDYLKNEGAYAGLPLCRTSWKPPVPDISSASANLTHRPVILRGCKTDEEADRLIDLLQSMFVLERPSVRQVMEAHPWLEQEAA